MPSNRHQRSYPVTGMTCSDCAFSVREELSEVGGVESVDIDLAEAGYGVTG